MLLKKTLEPYQITIQPEQLKVLSTNPVQLLKAYPKQFGLVSLLGINYIFGTLPYNLNGAIFAVSCGLSGKYIHYQFSPMQLAKYKSSVTIQQGFSLPLSGWPTSDCENQPIYLMNIGSGDVQDGDGTISILQWGGTLFTNE